MHKNKYDHNILLNDIQKLDKIQHKHSLVAIQFPDTSAEKKYLVYYDERWDCKLFLNYKTVCIFRKNRALAPHERSAVPLGTDHCPVC